jgi:hypothetical protein
MNTGAWSTYAQLLVAFLTVLAGSAAAPLAAEELNPPTLEDVRIGFEGHYKINHWTPVELTFQGGSKSLTGQVKLILPDGDGTPSIVASPRPVQLLAGRRTKVLMYAKFGRSYGELRVIYHANDSNVIDKSIDSNGGPGQIVLPLPLQADERLIVTLGASIGVEDAARLHQQATGRQTAIAHLNDVNELPTEWYGYDGVDWLVVSTGQPELFSAMIETGARRAALGEWVELGGCLLLTVGAQAQAVLAPDAPLANFAPGRLGEPATLRRTTDLESYVGGSRKVRTGQDGELALSIPKLEDVVGRIEVADGNRPLIVRSPRRFGQVVFVAVDLDRRPFIDWEGRGTLVTRLLGLAEPGTNEIAAQNKAANPFGRQRNGVDLLADLRSGIENFKGVTPISFALVAALILGYIVLIGPGDYFLVKRLLKRMELTWITFPIWVVLVSAGAYALAVYTKGDDLRLNQVDLIDVDVASQSARGTSWFNVFSPQSQAFDLKVEPLEPSGAAIAQDKRLLAWLGSGEVNMGGGSGSLFAGRYDFSPHLDELIRVPIQVWSTKGFLSRSSYQAGELITADLELGPDGVPFGTLQNSLSIPLSDCVLLSGSWAYLLGNLAAGDTARLTPGEQRDLKHVLRSPGQWNSAAAGETGAVLLPSSNVTATLEKMMFCKAAGFDATGGASNGDQQYVDLSDLLDLDRAIFVGHSSKPAAQLTNAGQPLAGPDDQHWTVYRFVFPVERAKIGQP